MITRFVSAPMAIPDVLILSAIPILMGAFLITCFYPNSHITSNPKALIGITAILIYNFVGIKLLIDISDAFDYFKGTIFFIPYHAINEEIFKSVPVMALILFSRQSLSSKLLFYTCICSGAVFGVF